MRICENVYWYREKGWMDANTFVIKGDVTVLIDPGLSEYAWMKCEEMREDGIEPQEIDILLITHSHPDHCDCLLYTSPSPRDRTRSRMPSSA